MDRKQFGSYLKSLRVDHGMTQADLASKLGLKYSQSIANIESGRFKLPTRYVQSYCSVFNLNSNDFIDKMTQAYKDELISKVRNKNKKKIA